MDVINNKGGKIGSWTIAVSNDHSITINRMHDVTIVSSRDRKYGRGNHGDVHRGFAVRQVGPAR
jgi:hypothetical protein